MQTENTPIACTLGSHDFQERTGWIRQLASQHLRTSSRTALALHLSYAPAAVSQVREMIAKEQDCCRFLHFDVREDMDAVHVVVTAPENAKEVVSSLFDHFAAAATQPQN